MGRESRKKVLFSLDGPLRGGGAKRGKKIFFLMFFKSRIFLNFSIYISRFFWWIHHETRQLYKKLLLQILIICEQFPQKFSGKFSQPPSPSLHECICTSRRIYYVKYSHFKGRGKSRKNIQFCGFFSRLPADIASPRDASDHQSNDFT